MKFKLDENMPADLAVFLQEEGHDAADVVSERLAGARDPPVLNAATNEGRILLTFQECYQAGRGNSPPGARSEVEASVHSRGCPWPSVRCKVVTDSGGIVCLPCEH
jgi:hypothetical protein